MVRFFKIPRRACAAALQVFDFFFFSPSALQIGGLFIKKHTEKEEVEEKRKKKKESWLVCAQKYCASVLLCALG